METAELTRELAPIRVQASKAEGAATALQIKTADDLLLATEVLSKIKLVGKQITEKKEGITKPLNEALRNVRALFAPLETAWTNAEKIVKEKMVAYRNSALSKADEKTGAIERRVESGRLSFEKAVGKIEAITPQKTVEAKLGGIQFRTVKDVVIEDETKLPREFLVPDMAKIRKVALAGVEIAGVKVVEKQIVAGTTKQQ